MEFLNLKNQNNLIDGAKLHPLKIYKDSRGMLMETIKTGWSGICDENLPFGQTYFSITNPGFSRDEDKWHVHPTKQVDRFVVLSGDVVIAMYDWRKGSPTEGILNLFRMGDTLGDDEQFLLLIPINVLHATCNAGSVPAAYLGNPSTVYDPNEEGRIPYADIPAKLSDGSPFSWAKVREFCQGQR